MQDLIKILVLKLGTINSFECDGAIILVNLKNSNAKPNQFYMMIN